MTEQKPKYKYDVRLKLTKKPQNILNSKGFFIEMIKIRLGNFLGFEFLVKNEELIHFSHKDEGIFEEYLLNRDALSFHLKVPPNFHR